MKNKNLYNQINNSLDEDTPDVLSKIKASDTFFVPMKQQKRKGYSFGLRTTFASIAVIFILVFTLILSRGSNDLIVASTITIDINPSIEITLDEFDNVINVKALNNDGDVLIDKNINYSKLTVEQTIKILIDKAIELNYISNELNAVLISVQNANEDDRVRVINYVESRIAIEARNRNINQINIIKDKIDELINNPDFTDEELSEIYHVTVAKIRLINSIIHLDSDYTIVQLKDKTIFELVRIRGNLLP